MKRNFARIACVVAGVIVVYWIAVASAAGPATAPSTVTSGRYTYHNLTSTGPPSKASFDGAWGRYDDKDAKVIVDEAAGYTLRFEQRGPYKIAARYRVSPMATFEPAYIALWQTTKGRDLGKRTENENGRELVGVAAEVPNPNIPGSTPRNTEIWRDAKTGALVRVLEVDLKLVYEDFEFGVTFPPDWFSTKRPIGAYWVDLAGPTAAQFRPPADAAMIERLTITRGKMSGVGAGSTRADVEALLGKPEAEGTAPIVETEGEQGPQNLGRLETTMAYPSLGIVVTLHRPDGNVVWITCDDPNHGGRLARRFPGITDKGVRFPATEDDVLQAYGQPNDRQPYSLTYDREGLIFLTHQPDGGPVVKMQLISVTE